MYRNGARMRDLGVIGLWAAALVALSLPLYAQDEAAKAEASAPPVPQEQGAGTPEATPSETGAAPTRGPVTHMPLPRYVSLKGSEGNARRGPSLSHRIDWVFKHAGMPLRVTNEYGHWRRIEDRDGAGGWVHYSLLSGVRTAIIQRETAELKARPDAAAGVNALAEAGAIVKLGACLPDWCEVAGEGEKGWVKKDALWGVDPEETRE